MDAEDDLQLAAAINDSLPALPTDNASLKEDNNSFINHLWELADESIEPLIYSRCQINVNAKISDKNVSFIVDTGAQTNVITLSTVKRLGIESFIDTKCKGKMQGVGTAEQMGIIPYIEVNFGTIEQPIICPSNFYVLNDDNDQRERRIDVLLGFSFMMYYKVALDFSKCKMTIMGTEVDIMIKEF